MSAGQSFAKLRRDLGVTRNELAAQIDSSALYITKVEDGPLVPTHVWISKATQALMTLSTRKAPACQDEGNNRNINRQEEEPASMSDLIDTFIPETSELPKLPIELEDRLVDKDAVLVPCDEPACIWKGGHVTTVWDPIVTHYALDISEDGWTVECTLNTESVEHDGWYTYSHADGLDDSTTSAHLRAFTAALEIAEDMAAELNAAAHA